MALDDEGVVWCWGNNRKLQCGVRDIKQIKDAVDVVWFKENGIKVMDIKCGWHHNLVLSKDNKVYAFGRNEYGQCGVDGEDMTLPKLVDGLEGVEIEKIGCGANHSVVGSKDGKWFMFGRNDKNQCLTGDGREIVRKAFCINEVVEQENRGKIKKVLLGVDNTQIIVVS